MNPTPARTLPPTRRRRRLPWLARIGIAAAVSTALLGIAACGSGTPAETGAPTGEISPALQQLHDEAVAAGETEVNYYPTALGYEPVIAAFQQRFPDIKVNYKVLLGPALAAQVDAEFGSGQQTIDVLQGGIGPLLKWDGEGKVEHWDWPAANGVPAEGIFQDNAIFADYYALQSVAWNTTRVSDAEVPKKLLDFVSPQWQDRVVFQRPSGGVGIDITLTHLYGQGLITEEEIRQLSAFPTEPGNAQIVTGLSQGKYDITPFTHIPAVLQAIQSGAPLKVGLIDDSWLSYGATSILKGSPHPKAARLLLGWLLSEEGQRAINKSGYYAIYEDIPAPEGLPDVSGITVKALPPDQYLAASEKTREITKRYWP